MVTVTTKMIYNKLEDLEKSMRIIPTLKWLCGFGLTFSILNLTLMVQHIGA